MKTKIGLSVYSVLFAFNCTAYTQELYSPTTRDTLTHLIQSIEGSDVEAATVAINSGAPVNMKLGAGQETPLMIAINTLGDLKRYKKNGGKVALASGLLAVIDAGMLGSVLIDDLEARAIPYLVLGLVITGASTIASLVIYAKSVQEITKIIKQLIKNPTTDVSLTNAKGETALQKLYSLLIEFGASRELEEIERLLAHKVSLKNK